MSCFQKIKTIFNMESKKFLQNKRTFLLTFLLGPIMILAFVFLVQQMEPKNSKIEIYNYSNIDEIVAAPFENVEFKEGADYEASISSEKNVVAIVNGGETVDVYYNPSLLTDRELLNDARKIALNIIAMTENADRYSVYEKSVNNIQRKNINDEKTYLIKTFASTISLLFFVALMTTNTAIGNMSSDAICGERERGTFDTLLLSGTKISTIVLGKMLFISVVGFFILVINGIALYGSISLLDEGLKEIVKSQLSGRLFWFAPFIVLFAGISILETSLFFAIASTFNKVKQAMSYIGIAQIFLSLFSYAPNILAEKNLPYVPIANLSIIFERVLSDKPYLICLIASSGIVVAIAIPLYLYTIGILKQTRK